MGVGMIMRMIVIMSMLFEMFVMMLMGMIVVATTAAAATALFLMRLMILRFQIKHFVMVLVGMVVAAPAIMVMMMVVPVSMIVIVIVRMIMAVVSMIMMMAMMAALIVSAAFRLEGTLHGRDRTTKAAQHFNKHMIVFDIDRVGRHFCRRMAVANVPCGFHQSSRIFGADFNKLLRRCLDCDEATIFELQGIAIVQHDGLIKIEKEFGAFLALERDPAAMAAFMIERDAIDQFFGLHGRLADCLRGAEHRKPL
jgi:hypothetical protein